MKTSLNLRGVVLVWLAWATLITGYQIFVRARFSPQRPDYALVVS